MYESLADNTHMNNIPKCGMMQIMVLLRMMTTAKKIEVVVRRLPLVHLYWSLPYYPHCYNSDQETIITYLATFHNVNSSCTVLEHCNGIKQASSSFSNSLITHLRFQSYSWCHFIAVVFMQPWWNLRMVNYRLFGITLLDGIL